MLTSVHRYGFILLAFAWSFFGPMQSCHAAPEKPKRPNFIFILVDDLRWNALGCMGDRVVKTPHIDKLAAKGVLFENAFVTTSICAVSRASILTGQWQRRHGINNFALGLNGDAWAKTYAA